MAGAFDILSLLVAIGVFHVLYKEEGAKEGGREGGLGEGLKGKERSGVELLEEGRREVGGKA